MSLLFTQINHWIQWRFIRWWKERQRWIEFEISKSPYQLNCSFIVAYRHGVSRKEASTHYGDFVVLLISFDSSQSLHTSTVSLWIIKTGWQTGSLIWIARLFNVRLGKYQIYRINLQNAFWILITIFSRESNSRIVNVCLSVCLSVWNQNPSDLRFQPINHWAYRPLSLSTSEPINLEPINHQA